MAFIGGGALILSSFWVDDSQTAVNRRYVGLLALGVGLYFTPTK